METTAQVSGQAADTTAGDDQTSPSDGHASEVDSIFPSENQTTEEDSATEEVPPSEPSNEDSKGWRKSDQEWQQMSEDAEKGKNLESKLKKALTDEVEKDSEKDPATIALEKIDNLEAKVNAQNTELAKVRWESDNPIVKSEKLKEAWDKVNKEKRYESLTYDERLRLIKDTDTSSITKALEEEIEKSNSSVPQTTSTVTGKRSISPEMAEIARQSGVLTDDDLRKAMEKGII